MSLPTQVMLSGCDSQQLLALRDALTAVMARRHASAPGRPPLATVSNVIQARNTQLMKHWHLAGRCAALQPDEASHETSRSVVRRMLPTLLFC